MKKLLIILLITISILANAFDFSMSADKIYDSDRGSYDDIDFKLRHKGDEFLFFMDLAFTSNQTFKYAESEYYADHAPVIREGNITYTINNLKIKGGKIAPVDEVDSPYSLFFSSKKKSSTGIEIDYEDNVFIYKTIWLELNKNAAIGYPDRGTSYKYYGIKLGKNWRFGYQDSAVYIGRSYDGDYFLNPVPVFFVQAINNQVDAPSKKNINDNSIIGAVLDYRDEKSYFYTQVLIDDFNFNRFTNKNKPQNPDKVAISTGYKIKSGTGKAGIYAAAATKYTFEPVGNIGSNTMYGYTYYPDTEYKEHAIDYKDNYIGYLYGENNVSIKVDYENEFNKVKTYSFFEFILSGAKSPANPWHDYKTWEEGGDGTKLFDKGELEKTVKIGIDFTIKNGHDDFFAGIELGKVFNKLKLKNIDEQKLTTENAIKIFEPSGGSETTLFVHAGYKINF